MMSVAPSEILPGIDTDAVIALIEGRHGDPFSILGPHWRSGETRVTVFLPGAQGVKLVNRQSGETLVNLKPVEPRGLFSGAVSILPGYRLSIAWPEATQEV